MNNPSNPATKQKTLRSACDLCHQGKVKCNGAAPCEGCQKLGVRCKYSVSNRSGRPKGVRNRKTLERIKQLRSDATMEETSGHGDIQQCKTARSGKVEIDQRSSPTPPSLSDNSRSQDDSNLSQIPSNSSDSSQSYFDMSVSSSLSDTDCPPFLPAEKDPFTCHTLGDQRPSMSNCPSPSNLGVLHPSDMSSSLFPEPSWDDNFFNQSFPMLPGRVELDHILKRSQAVDQHSSEIQTSQSVGVHGSQADSRLPSTCNCIGQITEQLTSFKVLSVSPQRFQPDLVLTVARDSLFRWRPYLQCPTCHHSDDKDILVLSVMALRALLNLIQDVGFRHEFHTRHERTEQTVTSSPFFSTQASFLGTYRLACDEKQLFTDILLYRTLKILNHIAKDLREKCVTIAGTSSRGDRTSSQSSPSQSSSFPLAASPPVSYSLFDDLAMNARRKGLTPTALTVPLDEHDNYIQKSLQDLTANIESLLTTIQTLRKIQSQYDPDTFLF